MRSCLVATELARRSGLSAPRQSEVFYATLMRFAGCAATSHEAAANFGGDDIAVRAKGDLTDTANPVEAMRFLASLGTGTEKLRILARTPRVPGLVAEAARADCEVGAGLVALLGLPSAVSDSVLCAFERYDGKGAPAGRSGADVPEPARFAAVGYAVAMFDAVGGGEQAVATVTRWSGRALDLTWPRGSSATRRGCSGSHGPRTPGLRWSRRRPHHTATSTTTTSSTMCWPASVTPAT